LIIIKSEIDFSQKPEVFMKRILLISLLIFVGFYSGCGRGKRIFEPEPAAGFYPLKVGNFWRYSSESRLYEYYLSKEVVAFGVIRDGIIAFKVRYFSRHTYYPDTVQQTEEWFTYQALINNEVREFSDVNDPDKYEILLRIPLEVGSFWQEPPRQMDSVWAIPISIDSVVAVENVTTPAGKFDDCYRIISSTRFFEFPQAEKWFKPQVGFVKYRNALGLLEYSLVSYKIIR